MVPHRSLTISFEPFWFWLRIRGDINNRKKTPRLGQSGSRRVGFWMFKKNSPSRGVAYSPTRWVGRWVGELAFECLKENSASQRIGDSPTLQVGELATPRLAKSGSRYGELGSRYSNFLKFTITIDLLRGLKKIVTIGNSPTRRVRESFFDYEYLRKFKAKIGTARNVVCRTGLCKNPRIPPHCHFPLKTK